MEAKMNSGDTRKLYVKFNPDGSYLLVKWEYVSEAWKQKASECGIESDGVLGIYSPILPCKNSCVAYGIRWHWHRALEDEDFLELVIKSLDKFPADQAKIDEGNRKFCQDVLKRLVDKSYISDNDLIHYSLIISES